ncbi:hypothetical protein C0030_001510 [Candidatus Liberibacter solanacearum]|uniref:Uncharacterized protein n=1 Tax=Candidatus Liberibacter solanacearum TaxID=556287 RepID=A0A3R7RJ20_9HYPH|nr:hypothetical protein C0030_006035 [Candidatus Liberibacter solanacearum]RPD37664.1 hypothetical protein C0030_001510 [Candidatus Liberibacter solanacearum]
MKRVAEICEKIDKSILPYRNYFIENAISNPVLNKLIDNIIQLQLKQNYLGQYFDISNLPSLERLKKIKLALTENNWFKFFTSNRRKALTSFRIFSRNKKDIIYLSIQKAWIKRSKKITSF